MYKGNYTAPSAKKSGTGRWKAGVVMFSLLILLIFTIGGTLAYLVTATGPVVNIFKPAEVSCEVTEDFTDGVNKKAVNVVNTGNADAWVRLKLVSYWINDQGQVIGGTAEIPEFTAGEGWVFKADEAAGTGYYYYTQPVAPGKTPATDLINSIELQVVKETYEELDKDGVTIITKERIVERQVIEVIAEAIQSKPDQAVIDAWGFVPGESNGQ